MGEREKRGLRNDPRGRSHRRDFLLLSVALLTQSEHRDSSLEGGRGRGITPGAAQTQRERKTGRRLEQETACTYRPSLVSW